jgi:hypothetical protein
MRVPLISLTVAGLLLGQPAAFAATSSCVRAPEREALDVEGLKSQLMVVALACDARDRYNAFVTRYKPELNSDEKQLGGYFSRSYGRTGQKQQDDYVTQLANSQSQAGTKRGTLFCQEHLPMFDEVMALRGGAELPEYAAGKELAQPISTEGCTAASPGTSVAHPVIRASARRTTRSKH